MIFLIINGTYLNIKVKSHVRGDIRYILSNKKIQLVKHNKVIGSVNMEPLSNNQQIGFGADHFILYTDNKLMKIWKI